LGCWRTTVNQFLSHASWLPSCCQSGSGKDGQPSLLTL
jgi:hypothetical protein